MDEPYEPSAWLDGAIRTFAGRYAITTSRGYWIDRVHDEFAFLEERGGRLDYVSFQNDGDWMSYGGPWGEIVFFCSPDDWPDRPWIGAWADLHGTRRFRGPLEKLARKRQPQVPLPSVESIDRETIDANLRFWADLLRATPDLF